MVVAEAESKRASRRDELVETALDLFYRHGFHATGIDRILAEAGVAKMTLYKHFRSKDELIVAALMLRDARFRAWFGAAVERAARSPKKRLIAVFAALEEWLAAPGFQGCPFINAAAEYGDANDPVHRAAAEHKAAMRAYLHDLAADSGADDPDELAGQLLMLVDGATVAMQVEGDAKAARRARRVAKALIKAAGA